MKSVHEGQKFPCPQCDYKAAWKSNLKKHIKLVHEGDKLQQDLKTEENILDDIEMEEYFERDVKSEV